MKKITFFLIALMTLASCSKSEQGELYNSKTASDNESYLLVAKSAMLTADEFPAEDALCNFKHYDFIAGQHIYAGHIYIGNDNDSLYLQISSTKGFQDAVENLKISFNSSPFSGRPSAGHFPYKYNVPAIDTVIYLSFPLAQLGMTCGSKEFFISIHGDIMAFDGEKTQGETAWGGNIVPNDKPWWAFITYTPKCCEEEINISRIITSKTYFFDDKGNKLWAVTGNENSRTLNCLGMATYMYAYTGTQTPITVIPLIDYWGNREIGHIKVASTPVENQIIVEYSMHPWFIGYQFEKTYLFIGTPAMIQAGTYKSGSGTWEGMDCLNFMGFPYQNADTLSMKVFTIGL